MENASKERNQTDLDTIEKCKSILKVKHLKWLVNSSHNEAFIHNDGLFSDNEFMRYGVAFDEDSRRDLQRVLLDVERDGEIRRIIQRVATFENIIKAQKTLTTSMTQHIHDNMVSPLHVWSNILKLPSGFSRMIELIFDDQVRYSYLVDVLNEMPSVKEQLLTLVNHPDFCQNVGKKRKPITDIRTAIGFIGGVSLKFVLPLMIVKSQLRFNCSKFPLLAQKLWLHTIVTANAYKVLMLDRGYSDEKAMEGALASSLITLGQAAAHQQVIYSYDEIKVRMLTNLRYHNDLATYNAMIDAKPSSMLMAKCLGSLSRKTSSLLLSNCNWGNLNHIKLGVNRTFSNSTQQHSDIVAKTVVQAQTFSQRWVLNTLCKTKSDSKINYYALKYGTQLSELEISKLEKSDLTKIRF
jgi:hypothetical protein